MPPQHRAPPQQRATAYHYPARMYHPFVAAILAKHTAGCEESSWVLDPFVGSGTTLIASQRLGLNFVGLDINPLAVLIATAHAGPIWPAAFQRTATMVIDAAKRDRRRHIEAKFPNRQKWFTNSVSIALSRLRRAIEANATPHAELPLWLCFAETVRRTSNSRLTTVKLHQRKQPGTRLVDPHAIFSATCRQYFEHQLREVILLKESGFIHRGWPSSASKILCRDVLRSHIDDVSPQHGFDVVITSPPYGENRFTIAYGQASFLPLSWLPSPVVVSYTGVEPPSSAYETDRLSLGGTKASATRDDTLHHLLNESRSLRAVRRQLARAPSDRWDRVATFVEQLYRAMRRVASVTAKGGTHIWTLGNRHVAGVEIPTTKTIVELMPSLGICPLQTIDRELPVQRRSAIRNQRSPHMRHETTIIARQSGQGEG